jgi:hypothetical protein
VEVAYGVAVRVLDDGCHSSDSRGGATGRKILARGIARVLEVYVAVHRARQREQTVGVDGSVGCEALLGDGGDPAILDVHGCAATSARADQCCAFDRQVVHPR